MPQTLWRLFCLVGFCFAFHWKKDECSSVTLLKITSKAKDLFILFIVATQMPQEREYMHE